MQIIRPISMGDHLGEELIKMIFYAFSLHVLNGEQELLHHEANEEHKEKIKEINIIL